MNKGIVTYCILTLAIVLAINGYVSASLMYQSKVNSIERHYRNLEKIKEEDRELVIVIGNSYVNSSMNKEGHEDIYKLIIHGMPMEDMVSIVQTLPADLKIKKLLIGLGYNYAMPIKTYSYIYKRYSTDNVVERLWWSIPLVRGNSLVSTIVKEDVKCLWSSLKGSTCKKERAKQQLAENMAEIEGDSTQDRKQLQELMQKSTEQRYKEFIPYTATVSDAFIENLKKIKTIADERNIELYAYTAPIYEKLRLKLPEEVLETFRASLARIDIAYVDLNLVYPDWDYSYFLDATHVHKETGGRETTKYLLGFIDAKSTGSVNKYAKTRSLNDNN